MCVLIALIAFLLQFFFSLFYPQDIKKRQSRTDYSLYLSMLFELSLGSVDREAMMTSCHFFSFDPVSLVCFLFARFGECKKNNVTLQETREEKMALECDDDKQNSSSHYGNEIEEKACRVSKSL